MKLKLLEEALELVESLSQWELIDEGDGDSYSQDFAYNTFVDLNEKIKKARDIIGAIKQTESNHV